MDTVYERALSEVGDNGRYQRNFDIIYNLLFMGFWSMAYMNIILALVVTPYSCELPQKPVNVSDYQWKLKYIPLMIEGTSEVKFNNCYIYQNPSETNDTKECHSYSYDRTWYNSTVPMDLGWVCNREINVANAMAYSRLGEVVGSVLFGWFGDAYGRRLSYMVSLLFLIIGRGITICAGDSFIIFAFGCIVATFPSWTASQSVTAISLEISSSDRRTTSATLRAVAFTIGLCIMPLLYWWLQNWKIFLIITTVPQIVFLLLSWKLMESPRWLWIGGKRKDCVLELRRIAKFNGTTLTPLLEQEILTAAPKEKTLSYGALALFSSKTLAFYTILQLLSWICVTLSYTVLLMSAGEKTDGNPFLEFAWQTAAEMPGNFLGAWLADRLGRRCAGVTSYTVIAGIWTIITFRSYSNISWMQYWWIGTGLFMLNRLFINIGYFVVSLFNMELYPTCLRQSGMSLGNVVTSIAAAMAPYIVYMGHRLGSTIPSMVLTGTSLLGILCVFLQPETLNKKLPETLEDAKKFGKTEGIWKQKAKFISVSELGSKASGKHGIVYTECDRK